MWDINQPSGVKLICGILAANTDCCQKAVDRLNELYGKVDLASEIWQFTQTDYYIEETGDSMVRHFISFEQLIDPGDIADIKHKTNEIEKELAVELSMYLPRPVNLDPGYIEPSKLVLASTKNFAHRIYIGNNMYAEVTLSFHRGAWRSYPFTFPDFRDDRYHGFLSEVRLRLIEQLRDK